MPLPAPVTRDDLRSSRIPSLSLPREMSDDLSPLGLNAPANTAMRGESQSLARAFHARKQALSPGGVRSAGHRPCGHRSRLATSVPSALTLDTAGRTVPFGIESRLPVPEPFPM